MKAVQDKQNITLELHKIKGTLLGQSYQKAHGFNFQTVNAEKTYRQTLLEDSLCLVAAFVDKTV